ncbi:MAG: hypothetical protein CTY15_04630 [Methylocystis sp.]|nr:MAG: hypothetical protein CTY15_04630 [Methylocystis sp.]
MEAGKMRLMRPYLASVFALLSLVAALAPTRSEAEGLLDFLFGPDEPAQHQAAPQRAPRDSAAGRRARKAVGDVRFAPKREGGGGGGGGGTAMSTDPATGGFCVRTCDGYFFPLIKSTSASRQQSCELACPSAPMEIYDGSTIESARNAKGQRYSSLPVAFAFRDRATSKCACNDPQSSQAFFERTARTDPTLRSGDVVVEDAGAFVYSGANLVPVSQASFMSSSLRDRLRAMLRRSNVARPHAAGANPDASRDPEVELSKADRTGSTTR